jgi:hypothetical protein
VLPLTDAVVMRASDIYADLYRRGQLIGDADILIAATALDAGRTLQPTIGRILPELWVSRSTNGLNREAEHDGALGE